MSTDNPDALQVLIAGGRAGFNPLIALMFRSQGWRITRDIMLADVVMFTGGSDVHPSLYGEEPIPGTKTHVDRDQRETEVFNLAKNFKIPMVGICRGAQLLNVLNGGTLWQDVDNHTREHNLKDLRTNKLFKVTSTHHQMMRLPDKDAQLIAKAFPRKGSPSLCSFKRAMSEEISPTFELDMGDPEVIWFPKTRCLAFQPHPEFSSGGTQTLAYFWSLFDEFIGPIIRKAAA